ncbi:MAG TPA: phenylacetate--CoA ligase [Smithellaceae bacterium]|jgi:phenylacetate-CoA ligase|nr:phenylacetate--CoA ligase [Syntrophaceae bacterium]NMD04894.1 phenylacetate--CoA ligase [Deltaproteobacteria bacterium]HOF77027.1 phenylacetate--CoA ligase [Smithellaceae bacterium]MBP8609655.1 phenylacetate--CoA ligase [Syntrophaceae bacterium]HOM68574.1 phenylacetate--CoA ligase [Smithellaceae bacterium]
MNIWDEKNECMSRDEIEQLQLERLQAVMNRVHKNVVHYRKTFDEAGIIAEDIRSLSDLVKIPFTTKEDLRLNYPYGMFAVPLREIVRIHSSSGTTGKPIVVGYTKNDIRTWSNLVARFMTAAGVTRDDLVQIAFDYGIFTSAFGMHHGAEAIGASVIPMGMGDTEKQIMIMQDYKTTVLVSTPSYALSLAERLEQFDISPNALSLKVGLFGGEPWSEKMREEIESRLMLSATDNYGLSEVIGPGVAGECSCKKGLHLYEDAFIPEIIDPETGKTLSPGQSGELVLTTLTKEAFPMIRYRTGDITSLDYTRCECGRTMARMQKVMRRSDDMLIIGGVNVFPAQIEKILFSVAQGETPYQLVVERKGAVDNLEVVVEVTDKIFSLELQKQRSFLETVKKRVSVETGISVAVKLVEAKSIPRQDEKIVRVVDKRQL